MNAELKIAILRSRFRTQSNVARKMGISDYRLSRIIHGYLPATDDEKKRLAKLLRQPVDALFPGVAA